MAYYLDSSAVIKLIRAEPETPALRTWLASGIVSVTSDLTRTEVMRAVRRQDESASTKAEAVLTAIDLLRLGTRDYIEAGILPPVELSSLDALHLAAALTLRPDLEGLVTYNDKLGTAAKAFGVNVLSPGHPMA
jgi:predicted nucleic acid-binding protein